MSSKVKNRYVSKIVIILLVFYLIVLIYPDWKYQKFYEIPIGIQKENLGKFIGREPRLHDFFS